MPGNRDDVVSGYVRMKIREWRDSGRELQDLARAAGFAKSTPSQVLTGTGIGQKTGPRFAKAFGFASFDAMKHAAFEWWKTQHESNAGQPLPSPAVTEAVEMVLGLGQGTTAQISTVLAAYSNPRFYDRDRDWWVQTLLAELARDRATLREDKSTREEIVAAQKQMRELRQQAKDAKIAAAAAAKRKRAAG